MSEHPQRLTHLDDAGRASMVDVGDKPVTSRGAIAEGEVRISAELAGRIAANDIAKGNLLEVARLAGIQAAKRTGELIPLCHPLGLDHVDVECALERESVRIRAVCRCQGKTGVEMEALTAVAVCALTVIDMGKAIDKGATIERIRIVEKWGGRSGRYSASDGSPDSPR
ncbi:MAG: cyclic pyranopterin monophosphate synthase MoaC [Phycisphaeraceae bacterium]|nr:cyclic pyranopterin monophosphate synthase MoaC [Phycisphaeraceae bacterium]